MALAHRAYDAVHRRDLDAFLAVMDADVEAVPRVVAIEGGYHTTIESDAGGSTWSTLEGAPGRFLPDIVIETVAVRPRRADARGRAHSWPRCG